VALRKYLSSFIYFISILPAAIAIIYYYQQPASLDSIYYILIAFIIALLLSNINSLFIIPNRIENAIDDRFENIQKNINLADAGIVDFARGESREEKYEKIASEAKKEILVSGIGFSNFVQDFDKIETILKKVNKFRILMLNPEIFEESNIEEYIKKVSNKEIVKLDVETNCKLIKDFQKKLFKEKKSLFKKLEFRLYDMIPTMTFYLTDPNSLDSKMVIDLLPYSCAVNNRPMIILEPHKKDDLYQFLLPKFEKIWAEAIEVTVEDD